jgi:hypothetical protein
LDRVRASGGQRLPGLGQLYTGQPITEPTELTLEFENNYLEARTDVLSYQKAGHIWFAANYSNVLVHSTEIVCRDTIDWE